MQTQNYPAQMLIKQVHTRAKKPFFATKQACAFDLFPILSDTTPQDGLVPAVELAPDAILEVRTGWAMQAPAGWCIELHSRSSQGKVRVRLANSTGLIDADYTGELVVILENGGTEPYLLTEGKAMCQAKLAPAPQVQFLIVDELPTTQRGAGGFGSTDQCLQGGGYQRGQHRFDCYDNGCNGCL